MGVYFRTQQGRTLRNDDMDVDEMTAAVVGSGVVVGYDEHWSRSIDRLVFHANTRHIVEWWDAPPPLEQATTTVGPPWALHSTHPADAPSSLDPEFNKRLAAYHERQGSNC